MVGRGLSDLGGTPGGNVRVIGEVASLAPWYAGARAVIAPIFEGSGMKTKVAEALMHGKKVIGTPEAFAGYEDVAGIAGPCCETADEFLSAIEAVAATPPPASDPTLRDGWQRLYSPDAHGRGMAEILGLAE